MCELLYPAAKWLIYGMCRTDVTRPEVMFDIVQTVRAYTAQCERKLYRASRLVRVLGVVAQSRKARKSSPCFTPLTPLAHTHHILIYAVIFGFTSFDWLHWIMLNHTLFLTGTQLGRKRRVWCNGFIISVRPSACIRAAPTGRIYVKFGNGEFYKKNRKQKTQIWLKSGTNTGQFTGRPEKVLLLESPKTLSLRVKVCQAVCTVKEVYKH
jgi:hypothetical protein